MRLHGRSVLVVLTLCVLSFPTLAAEYKIDPNHSKVSFQVRHLGISKVEGVFKSFSGTFSFNPEHIGGSVASATIETSSIDTDQEDRDKHLRGPDFLDVEEYPIMTFVGKKVIAGNDEKHFELVGDLTLHGVTKPVRLKVEFGGTVKDPWGNERAGFSAETSINRQDFGLKFNKVLETGQLLVGNEVKIELEIEGIRQK